MKKNNEKMRWKKGFNEVFRRNDLPETIKNGSSYVINLGEKKYRNTLGCSIL